MITHLKNKKGQEKTAEHQGKIIPLNWKGHKIWGSDQAADELGVHGRAVVWQTLAKRVGIAPRVSLRKVNAISSLPSLSVHTKEGKEGAFFPSTQLFSNCLSFTWL